ncbi:serine/threonine-protein phosphatase CPPED1 isoform X1 [Prionailurus viverrinus]|uniref:serine/threonine-protein phosphatase CPPED1 isoform X1 n=1 Tax=Prionailurus viverrinus TaxID=61388 RepID=UPI001FF5747D|nr:serine/threonine-protein phosphatase CPPED1 isoform X1 [Prionailurus viverrinus]
MSAAEAGGVFRRARGRTLDAFPSEKEREWKGPFYFIQGADPQFGLMKAWSTGNCDSGGDEWGQEIRLTEQAVQAVNKLKPRPRFFVLCGDLIHAMPGTPWRKEQTADLQRVLARLDSDIPLVLVSGNHDLGNAPTPETVAEFQRTWGDDYFSFWVGGVLCLVLNSQFWYDASRCPALKQAQDQWLDQQLSVAGQRECQHAIVFQHIPLFLQSIDEDDDYFNLTKSVRREVADKLVRADDETKAIQLKSANTGIGFPSLSPSRTVPFSVIPARGWSRLRWALSVKHTLDCRDLVGVTAVFSGHYHRNAGGTYQNLDMVVSSAIGCQLGQDTHGLRVVVVTAEKIVHRYYSLDELSEKGIEDDLMGLMKEK